MISVPFVMGPPVSAQTPSFQFSRRVASTANPDNELSIGMALDAQGNCHVTGWFDGTNNFGGGVFLTNKSGGGQDIFVAKYSSTDVLQWARRAGGDTTEWDAGRGAGVDNAGNVYVTGGFYGAADFGPFTLSGSMVQEFFLAKYDSAGTVQWARQSDGLCSSAAYGTGLAVDGAGNSYAVGYFDGCEIAFGPTNLLNPGPSGYVAFLVKYDTGGTLQWAQLMGGAGQTYVTKVALDAAGNIFVRGSFSQNLRIGTTNLISSGSEENMFVAKLNNAGNLIWVKQATGGNVDEGGVAVDSAGNVYVSGAHESTVNFGGGISLTNAGNLDAFVAKYNSAGQIRWARRAGGSGVDLYWDVAVDAQRNVYAAGSLDANVVRPGSRGAMIAKYDTLGTLLWTASASGGAAASPVASVVTKCAVDAAGSCFLAGWFRTATTFGTNVLQPQRYWNYFIAKAGFTRPTLGIRWKNSLPRVSVTGEISNRFTLEYLSSLATNNWRPLVTTTLTSNPFVLTDTNSAGRSRRFYRARLVP